MVARAVEKNLGLVLEPTKCARVDDAVAVPLILRAPFRWRLGMLATSRIPAELRIGSQRLPFDLFQFFACAGHDNKIARPTLLERRNRCNLSSKLRSKEDPE